MNKLEVIAARNAFVTAKANYDRSYAGSTWSDAGRAFHAANKAAFETAEANWLQIRGDIDAFVNASYAVGSNPLPHLRQTLGGEWIFNATDEDDVDSEFGSYGQRVGWILPR